MSNNELPARLRADIEAAPTHLHANLREAADRITQLEAVLRDFLGGTTAQAKSCGHDYFCSCAFFAANALLHPDPSQSTKETA